MQTLDVQVQTQGAAIPMSAHLGGKTGAETARNGSSFLSMIEKMITGSKEGIAVGEKPAAGTLAGRGAGNTIPGDENTVIKQELGSDLRALTAKKDSVASERLFLTKGNRKSVTAGVGPFAEGVGPKNLPEGETAVSAKVVAKGAQGSKKNAAKEELSVETAVVDGKMPLGDDAKDSATSETLVAIDGAMNATLADATVTELRAPKNGVGETETLSDAGIGDSVGFSVGQRQTSSEEAESGVVSVSSRSERRDKKAVIGVRDERSGAMNPSVIESPLTKSTEFSGDSTADMTIGFRSVDGGKTTAGENAQLIERRDGEGKSFSAMLSQELKNNAADFVKTGQIVLRDNNSGLIRLTLHPESLGNVKISLELSGDRTISGKIVVSSQEAYDAFNENLDGLSDAFVEGGFESAGFDLSWSGEGSDSSSQNEALAKVVSPFYASSIPDVMSNAESSDTVLGDYRSGGSLAINVFA